MDNFTNDMSEKLVQYLDGELTGTGKENVEQQLAADKNLQDELDNLKATREAVKLYGLQQKVSGIHQEMMQDMQPGVKKMNPVAIGSTRRILRYSLAVAASLVLIVGSIIAYNFYTLSSNKIFSSNYHSYDLSTLRDGDTLQVSALEKAYRGKDFKKVVELQAQAGSASIQETFLTAMAYVEIDNNTKAIDEFKKVIAENETGHTNLMKEEAEYYLALTYVRNKDFDLALEILRKIKNDPGHLYQEKVTAKLIRQVKMLKWR